MGARRLTKTSAPTGRRRAARPPGGWKWISPSSITFSVISIREPIELGERSTGYHVEIKQNGAWSTPKDSSGNEVRGTVIGQRQLCAAEHRNDR